LQVLLLTEQMPVAYDRETDKAIGLYCLAPFIRCTLKYETPNDPECYTATANRIHNRRLYSSSSVALSNYPIDFCKFSKSINGDII